MIEILYGAAAAYAIGDWIYHRGYEGEQETRRRKERMPAQRVDNGTPIGLLYGRTRCREPVVAWSTDLTYGGGGLEASQLYTVAIPFAGGTNSIHSAWLDDTRPSFWSTWVAITGLPTYWPTFFHEGHTREGLIEVLDGNPSQVLVDDAGDAQSAAGTQMLLWSTGTSLLDKTYTKDAIAGYRGVLSAFVHGFGVELQFSFGLELSAIPVVSFEASSYRSYSWLANSAHHKIGEDANPMCVLYDLLTGTLGKGGIPTTAIHEASWRACASALYAERHGYSNVLSQARMLGEHVLSVLRQIDAVLFEDPSDGLIHAKLIRGDYSFSSLREINKSNCKAIVNFAIGNPRDTVNRVRVLYQSREHDYNDRDAVAGNSIAQRPIESAIDFPGISNSITAYRVADRELAWRSMPAIKCRAIVDRSWCDATPGMVVKLSWTSPDVSNIAFRIARVDRGALGDGQIGLELIQDFAYQAPRFDFAQNPIPERKGDPRR